MIKKTKLYYVIKYFYHAIRSIWSDDSKFLLKNTHTSKRKSIDDDIAHQFSIFGTYTHQYSSYTGLTIEGKNILDVGPGISLAVSLMLKDSGANTVFSVDPFLPSFTDNYHKPLYKAIKKRFLEYKPGAATPAIDFCLEHKTHIAEGVVYSQSGVEDMKIIPDSSVDLVCSSAALEHITDPVRAFREMARVTTQGGYGLHQVDFRDHRNPDRPIDFLLFGKEKQIKYLWTKDGYAHGNGWRHSEYVELFKQCGFEIICAEPNMFAEDSYMQDFLPKLRASNSPHKNWPEEDLRVLSAYYVVKFQPHPRVSIHPPAKGATPLSGQQE